jgi:hypothetical protein
MRYRLLVEVRCQHKLSAPSLLLRITHQLSENSTSSRYLGKEAKKEGRGYIGSPGPVPTNLNGCATLGSEGDHLCGKRIAVSLGQKAEPLPLIYPNA